MARDCTLKNEIGSLVRMLARFEDFCDQIDLAGLGEDTVEAVYDNAAGLDWSLKETADEQDAVLAEIHYRKDVETAPASDPTHMDHGAGFWPF